MTKFMGKKTSQYLIIKISNFSCNNNKIFPADFKFLTQQRRGRSIMGPVLGNEFKKGVIYAIG